MKRIERVFEIKTPSLFISKDDVRRFVPDLDSAPSVKANGKKAIILPIGTKVKLWMEDSQFGWDIVKKGTGKEVFVLFPFGDPAIFFEIIDFEGDIERWFSSNWTVGNKNIVVHMFEAAGFNVAIGNAIAKAMANK